MKIHGRGQATPIDEFFYKKIRQNFKTPLHRLIFDFGYYTGERWGAILQLRVEDVYLDPARRIVRDEVRFRKSTRKDESTTRQVPIHPHLALKLRSYKCEPEGWLFPSLKKPGDHLSSRAADRALRRAVRRAGLENEGFSTHSTRRGFIAELDYRFEERRRQAIYLR